ncbi:hypothetical protein PKF05_10375 [Fusobacterium simiae]|uniref:hypothetical protein n=1 Tax=Fusobacterium simiae TaxID=855 RepID=UPI00235004C7|nr:hypothetical protein [Fusobacterium simiae]MDC7956232.1 hypothetical protein [Fusobacterium simiae]
MKKFLKTILFLCALSSLAYAEDDGMDVLDKMRTKIEKEDAEKAKAQKAAEEEAKKEAEAQTKALEEQQAAASTEVSAPVAATATTMSAADEKDAMDILDRMRARIEKEEEEKAKLAAEARELGIKPSDITSMEEVEAMIEAKKAEEAKPKTEAEKLEATRKKAMDKLDFYERVVRSVAREENEVSDYYGIMGEEKQRSTVNLGNTVPTEETQTKEESTETTTTAPVEATEAPVEVQQ